MGTTYLACNLIQCIQHGNKWDNAEWEAIISERIDTEIDSNSTATYELTETNNPYNIFGKGLVMALLNVNSLLAHIDELKIFTNANALDVLIIKETKLDSTIDNREVNIPGYEIIRSDRKINSRKGVEFAFTYGVT